MVAILAEERLALAAHLLTARGRLPSTSHRRPSGLGTGGPVYHWQMDGQTLAAWVQAAGSILAIIAAFLVSHLQHRSSLKVLKTQRRDANVAKLDVLFALAEQAQTLVEKANAKVQGDVSSYFEREFDSNDLRGLHEAFAAVVLNDLPSGNTVFAILRLKEVTRQMPYIAQRAVDDIGEHGGVSPFTCYDSEDLRNATNWAYMLLGEERRAAEQLL